jgi:hypothetical protein
MFRKIAILSTAVALSAGLLLTGSAVHASGTPIDASHYTVVCDTMHKGAMTFSPALVTNGTSTVKVQIKGTVSGCEGGAAGQPAVTVLSGTISGSLIGGANNCASLTGTSPIGGYLTVTWKTVPPLKNPKSTITVAPFETSASLQVPFNDFTENREFDMANVTVNGAFAGVDGGKGSFAHILSTEGFDGMYGVCATASGLKGLSFGSTEWYVG